MVVLGYETTLPVTLDAMVHHTRAVSRGVERAFVVADMPFLTYQVSVAEAVRNAGRLIQEGGAAAVKIEGGGAVVEAAARLVEAGIPVMGHLGLLPQSVHQLGGFRQQASAGGRSGAVAGGRASAGSGAAHLRWCWNPFRQRSASRHGRACSIPTIGIGAGPYCDGQVLVSYDMLGLSQDGVPPFVRRYADLGEQAVAAAKAYADDVRMGRFPIAATAAWRQSWRRTDGEAK